MPTPSACAARRLAASRSRLASRLRKSRTRRAQIRRLTGDAEQRMPAPALGPDRAARALAMLDPVADATQRQERAVRKRHGVRQPPQPRRDPGAVLLRKFSRLPHAAARRHRKHDLAAGGMDAQRIAARLAVAAKRAPDRSRRRMRPLWPSVRWCGEKTGRAAAMDIFHPESEAAGSVPHSLATSARSTSGRRPLAVAARAARPPLCDSTKSAMRGAISARKREPLKTP